MKREKKNHRDPRTETTPGYFLQHTDWLPENSSSTSFFSMKDTLVFVFLVAACFIVGTILWLRPPKIISYDAQLENKTPNASVPAKNLPKQLQGFPSYDKRQFEEIPDDDPMISENENDLPMKESEPENLPLTIKSEIRKIIDFILASLYIPRVG
jgi:hypothetical protein